jgi:hypothetical protein
VLLGSPSSAPSSSVAPNQGGETAGDTTAAPCAKKTHSNGNVTGKCS